MGGCFMVAIFFLSIISLEKKCDYVKEVSQHLERQPSGHSSEQIELPNMNCPWIAVEIIIGGFLMEGPHHLFSVCLEKWICQLIQSSTWKECPESPKPATQLSTFENTRNSQIVNLGALVPRKPHEVQEWTLQEGMVIKEWSGDNKCYLALWKSFKSQN